MPEFQDELIFRVDFNNVDGPFIKGSLPHASHSRVPVDGERVLVRDWEGNNCEATVDHQRGQMVYFELDPTTWTAGDDVQAVGIAVSAPLVFA